MLTFPHFCKMIANAARKVYKEFIFSVSSQFPSAIRLFYRYFYTPSKGSLSELISRYSAQNTGLKVLQIGANDGLINDPIHKFIRRDRWCGVLLEPQRELFENRLVKLHQKSEGIQLVNAALASEKGELTLYKIAFSEKRWASGLATFDKSVLLKAFSSGLVDRKCERYGEQKPDNPDDWVKEEKVDVLSFRDLYERYDLANTRLVQIDTEGFDFEIIKCLDFDLIQPDIIVYESEHLPSEELNACRALLKGKGYEIGEYGRNELAYIPGNLAI